MTKIPKPKLKRTSQQRVALRELKRVRVEIEDLRDYLALVEARLLDDGKPGISIEEAKRQLGIK